VCFKDYLVTESETALGRSVVPVMDFGASRKKKFLKEPFLGAFAKLRKAAISFVMSVCLSVRPSACNYSAPTGCIFMTFDTSIFKTPAEKIKVSLKSDNNKGTLHEDQCAFF